MKKSKGMLFSIASALLLGAMNNAQAYPDHYDRSGDVPDFGQHSSGWCWVAAASNSAYWWAYQKGYKSLVPASYLEIYPGSVDRNDLLWFDRNDDVDRPAENGYLRLLKEFASGTYHDDNMNGKKEAGEKSYRYSEAVDPWDYYLGLKNFFKGLIVKAVGKSDGFHDFGGTPSFDYIAKELSSGEDVELMIENLDTGAHHVITATSYNKQGTDPSKWYIDFKDSWNYGDDRPDHSNSTGSGTTYYGYADSGYDPSSQLTFTSGVTGRWRVEYVMSESVPEPSTLLLGVLGLALCARRRMPC